MKSYLNRPIKIPQFLRHGRLKNISRNSRIFKHLTIYHLQVLLRTQQGIFLNAIPHPIIVFCSDPLLPAF